MPYESGNPAHRVGLFGRPSRPLEDELGDQDRRLRGRAAELMGGQSPWAAVQAWGDWAFHLSMSPGRQVELGWRWTQMMTSIAAGAMSDQWAIEPQAGDRRFRNPLWRQPPFHLMAQQQLAAEAQWRSATSGVRGVADHHERRVAFMGQFLLNALAPVNFPGANPEIIDRALRTGGANFRAGAALLADDVGRLMRGEKLKGLQDWRVGETMALTPGQVVFRNQLMELILYRPSTPTVYREPILIVPAWIMKYYILDLTPEESLVRYLVDQGFSVFIISWKNPTSELAQTSFDAYRKDGVMTALDMVSALVPGEKVHGVGYCLGGTVLAVAAAAMDRDRQDRLATLTLLAAQTDFAEAGELLLFIDESQISVLEDMMYVHGYLDARKMAGAFYALRANEMVFAKMVERYLLGEPSRPSALDAWLADPTRMPARMHSEYLRRLFLENRFAHGHYEVDGSPVAVKDIHTPIFALGAERDHIAPWRSVHKIELYGSAETTFVLTGGGHNSSVVSPPGKPGAYYWKRSSAERDEYVDPDVWLAAAPRHDGSWWPEWLAWLTARSNSARLRSAAGPMGAARQTLGAAPGTYVLEI